MAYLPFIIGIAVLAAIAGWFCRGRRGHAVLAGAGSAFLCFALAAWQAGAPEPLALRYYIAQYAIYYVPRFLLFFLAPAMLGALVGSFLYRRLRTMDVK